MKSEQIALVQKTFSQVEPIAQQAGELLYTRLFEIDPSLRDMFRSDLKRQANMVMTAIGLAVKGLDNPDKIQTELQKLGNQHVGYGVMPADFDKFGAALLWSLEQTLGEDKFTTQAKDSWVEAFDVIRKRMKIMVR